MTIGFFYNRAVKKSKAMSNAEPLLRFLLRPLYKGEPPSIDRDVLKVINEVDPQWLSKQYASKYVTILSVDLYNAAHEVSSHDAINYFHGEHYPKQKKQYCKELIQALAESDVKDARGALHRTACDAMANDEMRFLAAKTLLNKHDERATDALAAVCDGTQWSSESWKMLGGIGTKDVIKKLLYIIRDGNHTLDAVECLDKHFPNWREEEVTLQMVDDLCEDIKSQKEDVARFHMVNRLGAMKHWRSIPFFINALSDMAGYFWDGEWYLIRDQASVWLREITGADFGKDKAAWGRWWEEKGHAYPT